MNSAERVSDFSTEGKTLVQIVDALNEYIASKGIEFGERAFGCSAKWDDPKAMLPERFRWLVAFAVEGESEGWYIHIGTIGDGKYGNIGHAKVWSADDAYTIAREAQRFLTAIRWN